MKTRITSLFLLSLLTLCSCGLISFDVGQSIAEQRVPGNSLGGLLPSFLPTSIPLMIDIKSETEKRNTGPASAAYLKSLTLRATPRDNPSGSFDFLKEVRIFIAQRGGGGSLPKIEIARLVPVPTGQTTLKFEIIPDVNLLPYINAGAEITSTASGSAPTRDFTFDGAIEVTIKI